MKKSRKKKAPRRLLALPDCDLEVAKSAVLNSLRPPHTGTYQCHVNDPDRQGNCPHSQVDAQRA